MTLTDTLCLSTQNLSNSDKGIERKENLLTLLQTS
jgi:hypothetical protein